MIKLESSAPSQKSLKGNPNTPQETSVPGTPTLSGTKKSEGAKGEHLSRSELEAKIFGQDSSEEDEPAGLKRIRSNASQRSFSESERRRFACSPVLVLMIVINLITAVLVILVSIMLSQDDQWNKIINGKASFPHLSTGQTFFANKSLSLDSMLNKEKFQKVIRRDPVRPFTYATLMGNFLLLSILHAIVIHTDVLDSCTEGSKWTSGTYIFLGLVSVGTCVLMNHFTIQAYEDNTRKASEYFFNSKASESEGNREKRLLMRNDEEILGSILTFCAYFSTELNFGKNVWTTGSGSGHRLEKGLRPELDVHSHTIKIHLLPSNATETYSLKDLTILGFCRDSGITSSIYILSIILPIICWAIPILNAIRGVCCELCLKKDVPRQEPHRTMTQEDKWTHVLDGKSSQASGASSRAKIHPPEAYQ